MTFHSGEQGADKMRKRAARRVMLKALKRQKLALSGGKLFPSHPIGSGDGWQGRG